LEQAAGPDRWCQAGLALVKIYETRK
jgi:hypothetical protein